MKLQVFRVLGLLLCCAAGSCKGKSQSIRDGARGPAGSGGATAGAGTGAGTTSEPGEGGAASSSGGSGGTAGTATTGGTAGSSATGGDTGEGGEATSPAGGSSATGGFQPGGTGGGRTEPPPLTDCSREGEVLRADHCVLTLLCPGAGYRQVECSIGREATWGCTCSGVEGRSDYEVTGLTGPAVCEALTAVCASNEPPVVDGPEECSLTKEEREPELCELERTCVQSVRINDEVSAIRTSQMAVSCFEAEGLMGCGCSWGGNVNITAQDGSLACDTALELCVGNLPDFQGEPTCRIEIASDNGFSCQGYRSCERVAELGDGVTASKFESWEIYCEDANSGGSNCACLDFDGRSVQFRSESPTEEGTTCARYAPLCGQADPVALTTEIECEPISQFTNAESCNTTVLCSQPATFDGEHFTLYGNLSAECYLVGDKFVCNCVTHDDGEQIEVEASTALEACTAARAECPKVVTVTIGDGLIRSPLPPEAD